MNVVAKPFFGEIFRMLLKPILSNLNLMSVLSFWNNSYLLGFIEMVLKHSNVNITWTNLAPFWNHYQPVWYLVDKWGPWPYRVGAILESNYQPEITGTMTLQTMPHVACLPEFNYGCLKPRWRILSGVKVLTGIPWLIICIHIPRKLKNT